MTSGWTGRGGGSGARQPHVHGERGEGIVDRYVLVGHERGPED